MASLLDVNTLIALLDAGHVHHALAHQWLAANRHLGWATCPIVQNGCVRVVSQPQYPGRLSIPEVVRRVRKATSAPDHVFWPDAISLCDDGRFAHDEILTPRHLTDLYLLALAVGNGGRLVTFDRRIPLAAVPGAEPRHLVVL